MATKKKTKIIPTVESEDEEVTSKGTRGDGQKRTNIAGSFTEGELAQIDALLDTPMGRVPRSQFLYAATMKAVRIANKKAGAEA